MEAEEPEEEVKIEEKLVKQENPIDPAKEEEKKKETSVPIPEKKEPVVDNYEPQKISEFEVINQDPSLKNYEWAIKRRMDHYKNQLSQIEGN